MEKKRRGGWLPAIGVLVLAVAFVALFWRRNNSGRDGSGSLADNALHKAKQKAVKMSMQVESMSITGIRNHTIQVASKVAVHNPLPVALHASRLDYTVMAGKTKVASGSFTQPLRIAAGGDTTVTLPMQVSVSQMDRVIEQADAAGLDSIAYTFYNTIYTDIPIAGETKIPFQIAETLPVVRIPVLKPGKLDLDKLGFKESAMDMVMQVRNPNPFTIRMTDGRYSMAIDGQHTMEGRMQEAVVLPAKTTTPVTMHMEMITGRALKTGWKLLFDKKETRYALTFDGKVASDKKLLRNSDMHFTDEGTLADLAQEVKKKIE